MSRKARRTQMSRKSRKVRMLPVQKIPKARKLPGENTAGTAAGKRMKNEKIPLKEGERLDDLQRGGFFLIQNPKYFCFGMDAVLLSAFACAREEEKILDLGTGTGIVPVLMSARYGGGKYTGLEINEACCDMAQRSVQLNGLDDRITILKGDIREADRIYPAASFDVVTANPPYMAPGHGRENADPMVAAARHEVCCTLEDVVYAAGHALGDQGRFYLVHRPFRLAEIFRALNRHRMEPKRMQLVFPYADKEPNLVLIEARKGAKARLQVEKPLVIYRGKGVYTQELLDIYYDQTV